MPSIELHEAQRDELECIENMMQFYTYDLSEWLPLKFGEHGFFSIQPEADYWRKQSTRPFLIKAEGELAGFVTIDNQAHFEDTQYNIGYLFVSRRYRGRGIAAFVVSELLRTLPGQWQILHLDANQPARSFWARTIPLITQGEFTRHQVSVDGYACTLFKFQCGDKK